MPAIGFSAGAAPRIAIAVAWAILAVGVVLVLDRLAMPRNDSASVPSRIDEGTELVEGRVELGLSAGFRVTQWRVVVGSREIDPSAQDGASWSATIPRPETAARFEILAEVQSEDLFAGHRHALQVVLSDGQRRAERTIWGDGDINVLIDVEEWLGR